MPSIFISNAYRLTEKHAVSRKCFYPAPAVDSMLIRMDLREDSFLFSQQVRNLIRKIFTQRRKQMGSLAKKEEPYIGKIIFAWLDSIEHPYNSRPGGLVLNNGKGLEGIGWHYEQSLLPAFCASTVSTGTGSFRQPTFPIQVLKSGEIQFLWCCPAQSWLLQINPHFSLPLPYPEQG